VRLLGAVSDRGIIGERVSAIGDGLLAMGDGLLTIGDEVLSGDKLIRLSDNTISDESGIASPSKSRAWDRVGKRKV
jgi:hypothetical protein